jgi:hypothetical protein
MSRFWELWGVAVVLIGAILALEATSVWPSLYWPGVLLVYLGLIALIVDDLKGKWWKNKLGRVAFALLVVASLIFWTTNFVCARVPFNVVAGADLGDYPQGTNLYGIQWDSQHYENLRVSMINSSDYDFHDVELSVASDLWIVGATQQENVCSGIQFFKEQDTGEIDAAMVEVEDASGKTTKIPTSRPVDLSRPSRLRVVCDKFPRHSTVNIVAVMIAFNHALPGPRFPPTLFAPKILPQWVSVTGDYRALGKTRDVTYRKEFPVVKVGPPTNP